MPLSELFLGCYYFYFHLIFLEPFKSTIRLPLFVFLQVCIHYPSSLVNKAIQNDLDASIVKTVASQEYSGEVNSMWKHATLKIEIIYRVNSEIDKECSSLCSQKEPSILRKTKAKQWTEFSERKCEELKTRAPTLYGCIRRVTTSSKEKTKDRKGK